ncbi:glycoside hydrolase family 88 protein [Lacrimispora sphenoides]|uniref:Unsaturated chondroitin disaccharide hydrolase n=1 Tax=Lacrimispora sphenoides JCM 1415 TaxID=1297793 RepID=A0ABY1C8G2_9FIRM|nr:glycoside hydrolase family 88 protein [Lacrimispora sphenoides]SET79949.1 unsaturated chondroitin disaccharide hydrolase [[Clostridium] sphenoides JCM 1415]SUY51365.1 glycosyl hydrolase family protein [Lacrimispora sphenoides]
MQTKETLETYEAITVEEAHHALDHVVARIRNNSSKFYDSFPGASSVNQIYPATENNDWTNGFWTGQLWLAYEQTKEAAFKEAALYQVPGFRERLIKRIVVDHHDMGFLYTPSCVAAYKLTGDKLARETALMAADNLMGRFQDKGDFFQAWGTLGDPKEYRLIIDCLLNMPLLFWASLETKDSKYRETALRHIRTSMNYVVREDSSTYHTYYFDPEAGNPVRGVTAQGYRDGSIWARGQAWGIYGSAIAYKYCPDPMYLESFRKITACFLEHLPKDLVPYWDFDFTDGSGEPRDSSSAAIAACGMLEMAKYLEPEEAKDLQQQAKRLIKALTKHCLYHTGENTNGILLHSTYAKSSPYNTVKDSGVDECTLWGDYFYTEALVRIIGQWKVYW